MWIRMLGCLAALTLTSGASALTQPGTNDAAATATPDSAAAAGGTASPGAAPAAPAVAAPKVQKSDSSGQAATDTPPPANAPLPEILHDAAAMPEPVRATWTKLIEAAKSGDVERLRPIIDAQKVPPSVAFEEIQDPIDYLKSLSGDAESREILAILLEVLEAGFVHVDHGTPQEMYVWPYFAQYPLDKLTAPQVVELFRLLTSADFEEMRSYGAYIFFRVGIAPDGTWSFFVAGD